MLSNMTDVEKQLTVSWTDIYCPSDIARMKTTTMRTSAAAG